MARETSGDRALPGVGAGVGVGVRVVRPSDLLVAARERLSGRRYGEGHDVARVAPVLAVAIRVYVRSMRTGQENVANFLRNVMAGDMSVVDASRLAGFSKSRGYVIRNEFRSVFSEACAVEGVGAEELVGEEK